MCGVGVGSRFVEYRLCSAYFLTKDTYKLHFAQYINMRVETQDVTGTQDTGAGRLVMNQVGILEKKIMFSPPKNMTVMDVSNILY